MMVCINTTDPFPLLDLPDEVLALIITTLPTETWNALRTSCKNLRDAVNANVASLSLSTTQLRPYASRDGYATSNTTTPQHRSLPWPNCSSIRHLRLSSPACLAANTQDAVDNLVCCLGFLGETLRELDLRGFTLAQAVPCLPCPLTAGGSPANANTTPSSLTQFTEQEVASLYGGWEHSRKDADDISVRAASAIATACPALERLSLSGSAWAGCASSFTAAGLVPLLQLPNLRCLELGEATCLFQCDAECEPQALAALSHLTGLTRLQATLPLTTSAMQHIAALTQLRDLQLEHAMEETLCGWMDDQQPPELAANAMPATASCSLAPLSSLVHLTRLILHDSSCRSSTSLEINYGNDASANTAPSSGATDRKQQYTDVVPALQQLTSLQHLGLQLGSFNYNCPLVCPSLLHIETDDLVDPAASLKGCTSLMSINVWGDLHVHSSCLAESLPTLKELSVQGDAYISRGVHMAFPFPNLEVIAVEGSTVAPGGMAWASGMARLQALQCSQVDRVNNTVGWQQDDLLTMGTLPSLEVLAGSIDCSESNGLTAASIAASLGRVTELQLTAAPPQVPTECPDLSSLLQGVTLLPKLEAFDLQADGEQPWYVTREAVESLGSAQKLQEMSLNVTRGLLQCLAAAPPQPTTTSTAPSTYEAITYTAATGTAVAATGAGDGGESAMPKSSMVNEVAGCVMTNELLATVLSSSHSLRRITWNASHSCTSKGLQAMSEMFPGRDLELEFYRP